MLLALRDAPASSGRTLGATPRRSRRLNRRAVETRSIVLRRQVSHSVFQAVLLLPSPISARVGETQLPPRHRIVGDVRSMETTTRVRRMRRTTLRLLLKKPVVLPLNFSATYLKKEKFEVGNRLINNSVSFVRRIRRTRVVVAVPSTSPMILWRGGSWVSSPLPISATAAAKRLETYCDLPVAAGELAAFRPCGDSAGATVSASLLLSFRRRLARHGA